MNTAEVQLTFYDGFEYFEPRPGDCNVLLLEYGRPASFEFDYAKRLFKLPYGRYTLVVEAPGFQGYKREILVSQSRVDLLIGLDVGQIADHAVPPPPTRIEGRVHGRNLDFAKLWVRAVPVLGAGGVVFDSRPDEKGWFSMTPYNSYEAESPKYVLLVLGPRVGSEPRTELHVIAMREVGVRDHQTTNIDIVIE